MWIEKNCLIKLIEFYQINIYVAYINFYYFKNSNFLSIIIEWVTKNWDGASILKIKQSENDFPLLYLDQGKKKE